MHSRNLLVNEPTGLRGKRTARMKSVKDGEKTRERETAGERERITGIRRTGGEELVCCERIRRECDRAREGNDRVREKQKEERMRRNDCRFGKSLSQQTAVHSALL